MIPYGRNYENKELYREAKILVGQRCLTVRNIPKFLKVFWKGRMNDTSKLDFQPKGYTGI